MAESHRREALERLAAVDHRLEQEVSDLRSLCPDRERATPLHTLGEMLLEQTTPPTIVEAFAIGLERLALAWQDNFPGNIFWDMDYLAANLLRSGDLEVIQETIRLSVDLQEKFGQRSKIRFRYVHDFIYGFDWTRWVARGPATRRNVGPFDLTFLRYLHTRCGELLELIAQDDAKYGKLTDDRPRNPFGFSREPEDERRLHELLATRGLIPVRAWRLDGQRAWEKPFTQLREDIAQEIGVPGRQ